MTSIRSDFPVFAANPGLVYLDSASTAQKPMAVIDAISRYLGTDYANIHRGAYVLSERSEELFHASKETVARFIWARSHYEIVYSNNATGAFNLLAGSLFRSGRVRSGDRIILSISEHHANIVPWLMLKEREGVEVEFVANDPITYQLDLNDFAKKLTPNTRVVSFTGCSNVTWVGVDFSAISRIISERWKPEWGESPLRVMDASQSIPHTPLNVSNLELDFAVFTGHKIWADTGIWVLWGRKDILKQLIPSIWGGGAINFVTTEGFEPAGLPFRFEPGTPNLSGAVSLGAAIQYFESIWGYQTIVPAEDALIDRALQEFEKRKEWVRLIGPDLETTLSMRAVGGTRAGVFSFVIPGMHAGDIADLIAEQGVCVRAGHHCAEPLHASMGLAGTVRASVSIYSQEEDIMRLFASLDAIHATITSR